MYYFLESRLSKFIKSASSEVTKRTWMGSFKANTGISRGSMYCVNSAWLTMSMICKTGGKTNGTMCGLEKSSVICGKTRYKHNRLWDAKQKMSEHKLGKYLRPTVLSCVLQITTNNTKYEKHKTQNCISNATLRCLVSPRTTDSAIMIVMFEFVKYRRSVTTPCAYHVID